MQELLNSEHWQELRRFAELGRMSAVLLHEISNPLTAALLNLESTNHTPTAMQRAKRDIEHMKNYVEAARLQIRGQSNITVFAVQPQLQQVRQLITPLARTASVAVKIASPVQCRLRGDPIKFQQIIINLVKNAVDAYTELPISAAHERTVTVTLLQEGGCLTITVADKAAGIAAEALPRLFEEFYTTKTGPAQGLGMGLAIVRQYVTEFEGTIQVDTGSMGTRFLVTLPLTSDN